AESPIAVARRSVATSAPSAIPAWARPTGSRPSVRPPSARPPSRRSRSCARRAVPPARAASTKPARCRHRRTPPAHANWFPTAGWKPNPRHRKRTPSGPRGSTWGPTPATSLPDTALESRGHFRLAPSSGESLPVGRGEMGKVSQVGDDLLPRTGAGADVLDQLPVTVGPAALLDD